MLARRGIDDQQKGRASSIEAGSRREKFGPTAMRAIMGIMSPTKRSRGDRDHASPVISVAAPIHQGHAAPKEVDADATAESSSPSDSNADEPYGNSTSGPVPASTAERRSRDRRKLSQPRLPSSQK